ncbi:MAG TPA: 2OG-Fe(II) oxygenase family protein [Dongiaceae bacterium]|jgi:isopenicillin N synthase-like dioxygenase
MAPHIVQRLPATGPVQNSSGHVLEELIAHGHGRLRIDPEIRHRIDRAIAAARDFYARPLAEKRRFSAPAFVEGYRDIGLEYSLQPDRPDLTESFSLWNRNSHRTQMIGWLRDCALYLELRRTTDALTPLIAGLFQSITDRWQSNGPSLRFEKASYIQLNHYEPARHRREMLQDGHEDGHLVTLLTATGPGLEIETKAGYVPVELADDELLVMPGSLLALMTGNAISPLYHRVHNSFRAEPRYSLMHFVNPDSDQKLEPWIRNESNAGIDIIERANALPQKFGLPTLSDGTNGLG